MNKRGAVFYRATALPFSTLATLRWIFSSNYAACRGILTSKKVSAVTRSFWNSLYLTKLKKSHILWKQGDCDMVIQYIGVLIPFVALSIPIVAIALSYRQKTQKNRIRELELQKEILKLEIDKQDSKIKLLEEENKKYDKIIYDEMPGK
ncbi:MAG: hypothetical protein LBF95_08375 [Treponema sp.]|nr:hypothetical protein [Treponema sp.]